jgi:HSP20 family protein
MLSLRDAMDRLFEENFWRPWSVQPGHGSLPIDLADDDDHYTVTAELPGVKPEDVQVTVQGETLTIRGETNEQQEEQRQNWLMRERRSGAYQRTITLPSPVNADAAEARFEHGTLTLTLPKIEEAKPRQIRVSGQPQGQLNAREPGRQQGSQDQGARPPAASAQQQRPAA